MILHIPHSSRAIPEGLKDQFVLTDAQLSAELDLMTDAFTDELFAIDGAAVVRFPLSRLVVDVERFADDGQEPMSKMGMGMIYTRMAAGASLRRDLSLEERSRLLELYEAHHRSLLGAVESELHDTGRTLIIDCHSFPSRPLPCDQDQSVPRPHLCMGTDEAHTPEPLVGRVVSELGLIVYGVVVNRPYAGTMVPLPYWRKDHRVTSIMIEVNRSLYMDEATGHKTASFESVAQQMKRILFSISEFQEQAGAEVDEA